MNMGTLSPMCSDDGTIDLTTLQDPDFSSGTWAGQGVSGTTFDPIGLDGTFPLTFFSTESCVEVGIVIAEVGHSGKPVLGTTAMCSGDAFLNLTTLEDPDAGVCATTERKTVQVAGTALYYTATFPRMAACDS